MNNITIQDIINIIRTYNPSKEQIITKAYNFAESLHKNQTRKSGELYIIHPLNVAYTLANMHADSDTICAGLLHDTIEDSDITKEEIAEEFGPEVAKLVNGVTKMRRINFNSKSEQNLANTRKIITSLTEDVRIIIIKLADRLHNMQTLEHLNTQKQLENAHETINIFVPLAYSIGAYRLKSELEDLALKYIEPEIYKKIEEERKKLNEKNYDNINEIKQNISNELNKRNFHHTIISRTKNICGIYQKGYPTTKITDITDLFSIKIMVENIDKCYLTLGIVNKYKPLNGKFKDYIANPKTNKYQSLHTTIFGPNSTLIQTQIRTYEMDQIACYGLPAYWDLNQENAREKMQADLKNKYQFFNTLSEINEYFSDNQEFMQYITQELLTTKIYVYKMNGEIGEIGKIIELPQNSTIIDFIYHLENEVGETLENVIVNGHPVSLDYILKNKDRVQLITNSQLKNPIYKWENLATTPLAKKRIKQANQPH